MKSVLSLSVFFLISAVLASTSSRSKKSYKVVCYSRSWADDMTGDAKFSIEDINPHLCTHLVYSFAKLQDYRIKVANRTLDLPEDGGLAAYQRFNALKLKNPSLKTLISIAGTARGFEKFSEMALSPYVRKKFVNSCVNFLLQHGFDGLDLDLDDLNAEYRNRSDTWRDKRDFVSLIREIKSKFQRYGFLLTAAVSAKKETIDSAYDIRDFAKHLDFINLLAYDFNERREMSTRHNAPLYSRLNDSNADKTLNVDYAVSYWLKKFPANKLILGMSFYGRGFILQNPKKNGFNAPVTGERMYGHYTGKPGEIRYNEICRMIQNEDGWTVVFEKSIQAPYAFKNREWIGYDNKKSIKEKVRYLKTKNLGGAMVWALDYDDFRGQCHDESYPLLKLINRRLGRRRYVDKASRSVDQY